MLGKKKRTTGDDGLLGTADTGLREKREHNKRQDRDGEHQRQN